MYYRFNGSSGIFSFLFLIFFIFVLIYFLFPLFIVLFIGFVLYAVITIIFAKISGKVPNAHIKIVKMRRSVSPTPTHTKREDYIDTILVDKKTEE